MMNHYTSEKIREAELELAAIRMRHQPPRRKRPPVFGPVLRAAGRTLRRAGEGLESLASAPPQRPTQPADWRGYHFD
jgi:hypothetical protein